MTINVKVTRAVAHAKCQCGTAVLFPIDDLRSHVTCPGCGEDTWLEERHVTAALEGYERALVAARRQGEEGADHVHLMVEMDATEAKRVH